MSIATVNRTTQVLTRSFLRANSLSRSRTPRFQDIRSISTTRSRSLNSVTMTTGIFKYMDPASYVPSDEPYVRPWGKVDDGGRSFQLVDKQHSVENIRDNIDSYSTDISGFGVYNWPAKEKAFTDESVIRDEYYKEVEELLRAKLPDVKKVVFFDHTIRRNQKASPRQPVQQVHVDQTPHAAEVRVRRHIEDPAEAEELLKGRYQIINVWRPIGHAASDFPLAVVDWRSTRPEDFVKVDLLYPVRQAGDDGDDRGKESYFKEWSLNTTGYEIKGETYGVAPNEQHKFMYVKDMTPDEAMFIKCFDSWSESVGGKKGIAGMTPHTAFVDPNSPKDAPGRQSIEVRCLVFYE